MILHEEDIRNSGLTNSWPKIVYESHTHWFLVTNILLGKYSHEGY